MILLESMGCERQSGSLLTVLDSSFSSIHVKRLKVFLFSLDGM